MIGEENWGKGTLEVHLRFIGGWGMDNLTAACGWMATGMRWRTARSSTFVIHTGRGMLDNLDAVLDGLHEHYGFKRVDIAPGELPGVTQPVICVDFSQ